MKPMVIKGYAKSVIGTREMNQDSFLIWDDMKLYAVADGVGGGLRGEVASSMAVQGFRELGPTPDKLRETVLQLQDNVLKEALESIGEALMGTTLTAIQIEGNQVHVCHVGDSRCYLFAENQLRQITEDHELFDESTQSTVLASY